MADLVRLREKFQVTIPVDLRRHLSLNEGDYLEVSIDGDSIRLRPQNTVNATSRKSRSILDFLSDPVPGGRTREEINATLNTDRSAWDK
jgi:AbrB family looped-hinge helix DNA binding protein